MKRMKSLICILLLAPLCTHAMGFDAIELGKKLVKEASRHDWTTVEKLITAGADVNQKDNDGSTALMRATLYNYQEVARQLIDAGADLNQKDVDGWTALMCAARYNYPLITRLLIAAGANVNQRNNGGKTALMYAASFYCPETVHILIDAHANLNQQNNHGWTALMYAAHNNYPEICRILISAGANLDQKNNGGKTALMCAAQWNHPEICHDIVRAYLVPVAQQKECIYNLLNCFKRMYRSHYSNLRNIFKPWLQAMIREISQPMYDDINQIEDTAIKEELLALYDAQHNQNKSEKL